MKKGQDIPMGNGKIIKGISKTLDIGKIELDELNPRISRSRDSELSGTGKEEINQNDAIFYIKAQSTYKDLKKSILHSRGATYPIWVYPIKKDEYKVIEGNTRLVIHKELVQEEGDDRYSLINCIILPEKIDEEDKDHIRLVSHLRGNADWDVYERAKYLYRLYENQKYTLEELSKITKLSEIDIRQDIDAYKIMENQFKEKYPEQEVINKFSYFKEYIKDKKLRYLMEEFKMNELDFCDWVGQKKIERAMDVRKIYGVLAEPESRKVFIKKDLERAREVLKDLIPETSDKIYKIMSDLSKRIGKMSIDESLEIKNKKSKRRKIVEELNKKIMELLKG
tara:strand:+ start:76 stop:1089 length:1014 start_codon:yes stop_codon:yes gene_type:complete